MGLDVLSNEGDVRYAFISSKALWHSSVHIKAFFSVLKKGKHLFVAQEMNLLRAATFSLKLCTSLMFFGGAISNMA